MATEQQQESKRYDVVIFGASGFTGKYVIREALKFLNSPSSPMTSLALAGRSPTKIAEALKWATRPHPPPEIPIIVADTTDTASLRKMAAQAKVLLNCVGPLHLYGEPVVAACVEAGCDYMDLTGEPWFPDNMEAKYHDKAAEKGSLVISSCGFECVVSELGTIFNSRQWDSTAAPNSVETYLTLESDKTVVLNTGTFESLCLRVGVWDGTEPRAPRPMIPGPPSEGPLVKYRREDGLWGVEFPSLDKILVDRTFSSLVKSPGGLPGVNESAQHAEKRENFWSGVKPVHFKTRMASKYLLPVLILILIWIITGFLGKFSFGRWLLKEFPGVFSFGLFKKGGPTEEQVESASFNMMFVGQGYSNVNLASKGNAKPDMEIVTRATGPEIGYLAAPIILIQCALVLLNQRDNMPIGGALTPGIVFGPTDLQQRLQQNGFSFDVISKKSRSNKI